MKEALMESLKEPVMKEDVDDPDGEGLNRFFCSCLLFMWRRRTFFTVFHKGKRRVSERFPDSGSRV